MDATDKKTRFEKNQTKFEKSYYLQKSNIPEEYLCYKWKKIKPSDKTYSVIYGHERSRELSELTKISRKRAFNIAKNFSLNIEKKYRDASSLLFIGGKNSGKTVLATLILRDAINKLLADVLFVPYSKLVIDANAASFKEHFAEIEEKYIDPDFLCIDDIDGSKNLKDKTRECIDYILTERRFAKNPTIITSRINIEDLRKVLGDSVYSLISDRDIYERVDIASNDIEIDPLFAGGRFDVLKIIEYVDRYSDEGHIDYEQMRDILYKSSC